ncbi:RECEPTOR-LIKE PROTEIN 2 [Salix purpurea]|uniref:RECEPTOR-LIKE PROTEIN 2 n=1 Tax=Salix purpurea TaxID=77065 RepID=A0A9Q0VV91_SALPP|nr:RECEPTOR-LIKE PROTEIN 2 [Salix purpurea]
MLGFNRLHGPIPESIFRLPNLEALDLQENLFRGTVNVGLLRSRSLVSFQLSGNNLSVIGNNNDSFALPKFQILGLGGCNLSGEFPSFLHGQTHLESVDLSENKIEGHIPKWFMNLGNLRYLRLSLNKLEGALPIPPRLCGKPLSRKCGNGEDSLPAANRDEGSVAYQLEFGWKVVVIGYASGLVIGVILGCVMDTRKYEWLVKNYFARWQR